MIKIKLYYSSLYLGYSGHAFVPEKYREVAKLVKTAGLESSLVEPTSASSEDIRLVHNPLYVDAVINGTDVELASTSGFKWSREFSSAIQYMSGGCISAAESALEEGIAGNIASGFHHATRDRGYSFCTFNGLAIAVEKLKRDGKIKRALIVDTDVHLPNGLFSIYQGSTDTYVLSFSETSDAGSTLSPNLRVIVPRRDIDGRKYHNLILEELNRMIDIANPDIILYHSGADMYKDDPQSPYTLSIEDLKSRDAVVFETAKRRGIPMMFTFGGGYSDLETISKIHFNTIMEANRIFDKAD